jgi:sulfonate transport system ATP-binding protein
MQRLIERLWQRHGFTALLVTHDVGEAIALADRVLLIEDHRIALDQRVALPRPRLRGQAAVATHEERLLERVIQQPNGEAPAPLLPATAHALRRLNRFSHYQREFP